MKTGYVYCAVQTSGDGQSNGNARTLGITMCWLHWKNNGCEDLSLFFCLFTLYSANFIALQIVFNKITRGSTAKWETCQISKEGRWLVEFSWSIRKQTRILLGLSRAALAKVMIKVKVK